MVANSYRQHAEILLMSEDDAAAERWRAHIRSAGWRTLRVRESIDALSAARNGRADLAVLHLSVDDSVAMDLPGVFRTVCPETYLPVVVLADEPGPQNCCEFLDGGADDIVCTRTDPAELVARLRALLRVKQLHDQLAASRAALEQALARERTLLEKLRRENSHLQDLVATDPLTHLQNRRSFQDLLDHAWKGAKRYGRPLSLLALDVDHFKVVNDVHGHPSGDYILKELAVILTRSVRESDVVARTGGEEFCVLLPQADTQRTRQFAERIRTGVFGRRFTVFGRDIHVTVSIGTATWPDDAEITDPQMLLYFADQALLMAKETGRDRVVSVHDLPRRVRARLRHQYEHPPLETAPAGGRRAAEFAD